MANWWYDKGLEKFAKGEIDFLNDTIKVVCVDSDDYTLNTGEHDALADIPGGARVATSSALTGKSCDYGVLDANDPTLYNVTGDQFEYVIMYKECSGEDTSWLMTGMDTAAGLPFTPSGSHVQLQFDSGEFKIGKL
jgi:hypothetical protein